jgi:hypothetical protein
MAAAAIPVKASSSSPTYRVGAEGQPLHANHATLKSFAE